MTVALTLGDTTIVSGGVNPGETVVTDGQDKLQRGSLIVPRNTAPNTGNGARPANGGRHPAAGAADSAGASGPGVASSGS